MDPNLCIEIMRGWSAGDQWANEEKTRKACFIDHIYVVAVNRSKSPQSGNSVAACHTIISRRTYVVYIRCSLTSSTLARVTIAYRMDLHILICFCCVFSYNPRYNFCAASFVWNVTMSSPPSPSEWCRSSLVEVKIQGFRGIGQKELIVCTHLFTVHCKVLFENTAVSFCTVTLCNTPSSRRLCT
jgi:hypothetical protein